MLKELIQYIKEYEGDNDLGDYLDTRYVRLTEQHYDQIAGAMSEGELELKKSSSCPAERFFLHFNETILFVNKLTEEPNSIYDVEMIQNDAVSDDDKELLFVSFSIDDEEFKISSINLFIFSWLSLADKIVILSTKFLNSLTFPGQL